jgi:coiled-coil domain-containing protein 130
MQGFNMGRYHPPASLDPALSTDPSSSRRTRASAPPTIRFEMPFAVWCTTCDPEAIIGQGVRFNATKTKVGAYHSTPIWSFVMRHTVCGAELEIRTDPAAGDYEVFRGGRRRDYGVEEEAPEALGAEERERRAADPFAGLEGRVAEGIRAKSERRRVEELKMERDGKWEDVWAANRRLRSEFRVVRKELEAKDRDREAVAERLGLGIHVLDATDEDGRRAALVAFGEADDAAVRRAAEAPARPLFKRPAGRAKDGPAARSKDANKKTLLQQSLADNTRAIVDPFLQESPAPRTKLAGIKRKREADVTAKAPAPALDRVPGLVSYSSESE